jgi:hypothetical protein
MEGILKFKPTQQYAVCADMGGEVQITLTDDWAMADDRKAWLIRLGGINWVDIIDFTEGGVVATAGTHPKYRNNPNPFGRGCDDDCRCDCNGCEG